jgi:hypothetical protein
MRRALDGVTLADLLQSEGRLSELLRARLAEAVLAPTDALFPVIAVTAAPGDETTSRGMS